MKEIFTEEGEKVSTINFARQFIQPYIRLDTLQTKEKEPVIEVSNNIDILKNMELILYAKPISKEEAWAKRQNYIVYLLPEDSPKEKSFKILKKIPHNHLLEIDTANYKIRIVGPFVYGRESDWVLY